MVKVMNYVWASAIYILINAALYSSNYMEEVVVHGRAIRGVQFEGGGNIGEPFGSVHQGGGAQGLSRTGTGGGSRM